MTSSDWNSLFQNNTVSLANKKTLITGCSSGIGLAAACMLASEGTHLILMARREEKLIELQKEISKRFPKTQIQIVVGDVRDKSFLRNCQKQNIFDVDILVNNAGLARGRENAAQALESDWEEMLDTNVKAAFNICKLTLPYMENKKSGHIVFTGSIAGHEVYSGGTMYCATKHAVTAFCKALRLETCDKNIRVSLVSPGMVNTEFSLVRFHGDASKAVNVYQNMNPLTAQDIAQQILHCLKQPAHVNVNDIIVMPTQQGNITTVSRNS